jgi:hypothetical protein
MKELSKSEEKRISIQREEIEKAAARAASVTPPDQPEFIPWINASTEMKIDRLHFVVKDIIKSINAEQKKVNKIEAKFYNHKHVENQLMQIISQFEAPDKEDADTRKPEEIWF